MAVENKIREHYQTNRFQGDDHLHIGGAHGTSYFVQKLSLKRGQRVLDVGCGLGGPARYMASNFGVRVSGVDLSPDFIQKASALTEAEGLSDQVDFQVSSASRIPFDTAVFDVATLLHVGMNIADKLSVFKDVHRVLKPSGLFGLYDIYGSNAEPFRFPVPWAATAETSFLESREQVKSYLQQAGFKIVQEEGRRDYALAAMQRALGADNLAERRPVFENLYANIEDGLCAPHICIVQKI